MSAFPRRRAGSMQSRPSPRSPGCWPLPRPPFGLPAVSTGAQGPELAEGRQALSLRSIPRANTALPSLQLGGESEKREK